MPSAASFDAAYNEVCTGNGAVSGVGKISGSPYTLPVDEKAMRRAPAARMASSTFQVTMVFCSRSRRGWSGPKRTSALAARWKTKSAARHGVRDGVQFQQVALDQAEARIGLRTLQKTQESGGQIVEAGDVVAGCQQAVHQIAADESRRSRNECSHFNLPPNRCSSPIRKMSRTLRRLPLTRLSRLSASSRQRIGNCSIR